MAEESKKSSYWIVWVALTVIGFGTFIYSAASGHPDQAWKAYLINFLIWSAIAQGGLLFSTLMHTVKAKWSGPLSGLSEAFSGFFPVSFVLFLILFFGGTHVFPWSHGHDLHGKEVWLNIPFLFTRDFIALLILYGLGFGYLYYSLQLKKVDTSNGKGIIRALFRKLQGGRQQDPEVIRKRVDVLAILYMLAFTLVLSLLGYDLVMALDPHWISTLFGAYTFVKAIYVGLGGLIIFAAVMHLNPKNDFTLPSSQFHDIGKLYFAFCLVWADFFYVQLVVIWYGNIPEETAYVIERVMMVPWKYLAWFVFAVSFVIPFFILLNKKVKTMPAFMMVLAACMIAGIWLEHLLLVGPSLSHSTHTLPLGIKDFIISLGFLGLMVMALNSFLRQFPELARTEKREVS
ncbi:MAG: hypothetical protein PVJ29_14815 [Desulfobacterales bacterium]|jgi:hypothetical protein